MSTNTYIIFSTTKKGKTMVIDEDINDIKPIIEIRKIGLPSGDFEIIKIIKRKSWWYKKDLYFISCEYGSYSKTKNTPKHILWHLLTKQECETIKKNVDVINFYKLKDSYTSDDLDITVCDGSGFDFFIDYEGIVKTVNESNFISFIPDNYDENFSNFINLIEHLNKIIEKKNDKITVSNTTSQGFI